MLTIEWTHQFKKDYRLAIKRGKNMQRLQAVVNVIAQREPLPPKYKPHKLTGDYTGKWECHVEPDFLLIYEFLPDTLMLHRLGSHSDLF